MNNSNLIHELATNLHLLHNALGNAMVYTMCAYEKLEKGNPRVADADVIPLGQSLQEARSLLDAILSLNPELN
jgi:hypothetical protein